MFHLRSSISLQRFLGFRSIVPCIKIQIRIFFSISGSQGIYYLHVHVSCVPGRFMWMSLVSSGTCAIQSLNLVVFKKWSRVPERFFCKNDSKNVNRSRLIILLLIIQVSLITYPVLAPLGREFHSKPHPQVNLSPSERWTT